MPHHHRAAPLVVAGSLAVAFLAACPSIPQNRVDTFEQAVSTHLAVLSTKRWDEYVEQLQPAFKLTADDALLKVLPETLRLQDSSVARLGVGLQYRGADSDVTKPRAPSPVYDAGAAATPSASSLQENDTAKWLVQPLVKDPVLQYLAATALFQEVQLLNTYIKDAALSDKVAYIVRLQLSILPRRHYEPYDAYATIALQGGKPGERKPSALFVHGPAEPERDASNGSPRVDVLPLLVTDNLESALRQSSREQMLDIALATATATSAITRGANIAASVDELRRAFARDYNALYTVASEGNGAVRVRIGAPAIGMEEYAMTTRTQNITLLVLVKKGVKLDELALRAVCKVELRDAKRGTALPSAGESGSVASVNQVLVRFGLRRAEAAQCRELLDAATSGEDKLKFDELLAKRGDAPTAEVRSQILLELVDIAADGPLSEAAVSLPDPPAPHLVVAGAITPLVLDDGATTQVVVSGGVDFDRVSLVGTLTIAGPSKSERIVADKCESVAESHGRAFRSTFPSLRKTGLVDPRLAQLPTLTLDVQWRNDEGIYASVFGAQACRYVSTEPTNPLTLRVLANRLTLSSASSGKDTVTLVVVPSFPRDSDGKATWPSGEVAVEISNADFESVAEPYAKLGPSRIVIGSDPANRPSLVDPFALTVTLKGLVKGRKVTLTPVYAGKKNSDSIDLNVDT